MKECKECCTKTRLRRVKIEGKLVWLCTDCRDKYEAKRQHSHPDNPKEPG